MPSFPTYDHGDLHKHFDDGHKKLDRLFKRMDKDDEIMQRLRVSVS